MVADALRPQDQAAGLPDDAKVVRAAIIPPSLVSDRYVQLADFASCTTGCPVLASGAAIPMNQTAAPVELDDIYAALDKLNVALGPKGANSTSLSAKGPLSDLIDVGRGQPGRQRRRARQHRDQPVQGGPDAGRRAARTCSAR